MKTQPTNIKPEVHVIEFILEDGTKFTIDKNEDVLIFNQVGGGMEYWEACSIVKTDLILIINIENGKLVRKLLEVVDIRPVVEGGK